MKLYHNPINDTYTSKCVCGACFGNREKLFYHIGRSQAKNKAIIEIGFTPILVDNDFYYKVKCNICQKEYYANQYIWQYRHYLKHKRGCKK